MENSWYASDRQDTDVATVAKVAEPGSKNVITSIYAGYSSAAQTGTVTVTIGAIVTVIDIIGQANLQGLDIAGGTSEAVTAALSAGGAGVNGSLLLNGYTK